ncbi:MAG TPA: FtsX-like permease family protein [Candidatus Limnocylindria bacterium]|nr:FtsX-like permease family protein [Candidatus Limnocylindria bacterium]
MQLSALAWRTLSARPMRTALTAAGVALGVAIVAATLITNEAADQTVERAARELFGRAELRVRAFDDAGLTPRALSAISTLPGVDAVAPVAERQVTASTAPGPNERVFSLTIIGVDPAAERAVRTYDLVDGVFLSPDNPTDVLLNAQFAADHGLAEGDELRLSGRGSDVAPLRIVGLLDDVGFGALAQGEVAVMSRDALDRTFEVPAPTRYVDLVVHPGAEQQVQRELDATLTEPFVVETVADAAQSLAGAQASFAGIAFLFGLVALVVAAFLVGNTLALTLREQMREIGLLRAAGTTRRQVLGLFLRQGLAIGLLGSLGGILAGIVIAATMIGFLRTTRSVLIDGFPLNPLSLLLAFAIGIVVTLLGTALPALQAARLPPLEALRPVNRAASSLSSRLGWLVLVDLVVVGIGLVLYPLDRGSASLPAMLLALAILVGGALAAAFVVQPLGRVVGRPFEWFFGAEGLLGRANLGRDRLRAGLTVGTLMIALAAVVALGSLSASAEATAERWVASILPGGHAVRLGLPVDQEAFQATFEDTTGTLRAAPIAQFGAVIRQDGAQREVSVAAIDPSLYQDGGALIFTEGRRNEAFQALRDGGAVLVPDDLARRQHIKPGDTLLLAHPGEQAQPFTVAGVVAYSLPGRSSGAALLMSLADARDAFGVTTAALWAMVPQPGISEAAFSDAVAATANELAGEPVTARQLADDLSRSLERIIGLFDVLALVTVVVAALGIVNTLSVGVVERVREIAILRAHGMTVGQVQAMVVAEAAIMGAIGGLLAAGIGLGVAWIMVVAGAPQEFAAGLSIAWPVLVSVVLLGTAVAALAGLYPARLAARQPLVRSFKHFE